MVTPNAPLGNANFAFERYGRSGMFDRSCRPAVAVKQESGLAIGQVSLEAAIVRGNYDTKGRRRSYRLIATLVSSRLNSTLSV